MRDWICLKSACGQLNWDDKCTKCGSTKYLTDLIAFEARFSPARVADK